MTKSFLLTLSIFSSRLIDSWLGWLFYKSRLVDLDFMNIYRNSHNMQVQKYIEYFAILFKILILSIIYTKSFTL